VFEFEYLLSLAYGRLLSKINILADKPTIPAERSEVPRPACLAWQGGRLRTASNQFNSIQFKVVWG
jgi:hypothetical protein